MQLKNFIYRIIMYIEDFIYTSLSPLIPLKYLPELVHLIHVLGILCQFINKS